MGRGAGQPLLRQSFQRLGDLWELWPVGGTEEPALHQDILHLPAGLQVGKGGLDPLPHLPDDRLWRLLLPRPLAGEQLVPHRSERVYVTCPASVVRKNECEQLLPRVRVVRIKVDLDVHNLPGEGQVFACLLVNPELPDHLRSEIAQPTGWNRHPVQAAHDLCIPKQINLKSIPRTKNNVFLKTSV